MNIYTTTLATLNNPEIKAIREEIRNITVEAMADIKISQLLIDRGLILAEVSKDFIVEENLELKALEHMTNTLRAKPEYLFNGSNIIDGVLWPEDMGDEKMPEVVELFKTLNEHKGDEGAACICFMNFIIGEVMMERIA